MKLTRLWWWWSRSCWSHLIFMTENYPLRWDPVPAGCHGDITRASVNAGAATRNHPDPEFPGKAVELLFIWGRLYISYKLPPGTFLLFVWILHPLLRLNGNVQCQDVYSLTPPRQVQLQIKVMKDTHSTSFTHSRHCRSDFWISAVFVKYCTHARQKIQPQVFPYEGFNPKSSAWLKFRKLIQFGYKFLHI